jgi:hypothetical protein
LNGRRGVPLSKLVTPAVLAPVDEPEHGEIDDGKAKERGEDDFAGTINGRGAGLEGLRAKPVSNAIG